MVAKTIESPKVGPHSQEQTGDMQGKRVAQLELSLNTLGRRFESNWAHGIFPLRPQASIAYRLYSLFALRVGLPAARCYPSSKRALKVL